MYFCFSLEIYYYTHGYKKNFYYLVLRRCKSLLRSQEKNDHQVSSCGGERGGRGRGERGARGGGERGVTEGEVRGGGDVLQYTKYYTCVGVPKKGRKKV